MKNQCWVLEVGGDRCVLRAGHPGPHMGGHHTFEHLLPAEEAAQTMGATVDLLLAEVRRLRGEPPAPRRSRTMCLVRPEFHECPTCAAKPGSPDLCRECLERRALYSLLKPEMVCPVCRGGMDCECPEHGR